MLKIPVAVVYLGELGGVGGEQDLRPKALKMKGLTQNKLK